MTAPAEPRDNDGLPAPPTTTRRHRPALALAFVTLTIVPAMSATAAGPQAVTTTSSTTTTTTTAPTTTTATTTTTTTPPASTTPATTATSTVPATTVPATTVPAATTVPPSTGPTATTVPPTTAPVARPAAPTNVRGRRSGTTVALAWDAVPGATSYRVYVATSGAGPFTVAGTRSTPAFTVGDLGAGSRHYFRVAAGNAAGWSAVSATLVVEPGAATQSPTVVAPAASRPAAPVNLRGRRSGSAVALAWNAVAGATTYKVYVATSGAGPFRVAGTWSTPGFTVGNLDSGTRYYFRVSAGNATGWSPTSTTLVMPGLTRPTAPSNVRVRRWSDNVSVAWDAVPGASWYNIYLATSGAGPYTKLNTWPRPSYTVGGVSPTTRYYIRVSAGNAIGWSPTSVTLVVPPVVIDPNAIPARNPGAPPVGLVGDSVLAALTDLGPSWGNLSGNYDVVANTRVCRRLVDVTCDGRGDPSALSILRTGAIRGDVLIIGMNSEWAPAFGSAVDQVMAQARALGFRRVIWLTSARPGSNSAQVNTILRQRASTAADMQVADWAAYSAGHPEWFWSDGIHLRTAAGKLAMANFLAAQVAAGG